MQTDNSHGRMGGGRCAPKLPTFEHTDDFQRTFSDKIIHRFTNLKVQFIIIFGAVSMIPMSRFLRHDLTFNGKHKSPG